MTSKANPVITTPEQPANAQAAIAQPVNTSPASEQAANEHTANAARAKAAARQARWQKIIQLLNDFATAFPQAFPEKGKPRLPLKVGIHQDIMAHFAASGTPISVATMRQTMSFYMSRLSYLRACRENAARVDLNGNPVGIVNSSEAGYAKERLQAILAKRPAQNNEQHHQKLPKHRTSGDNKNNRAPTPHTNSRGQPRTSSKLSPAQQERRQKQQQKRADATPAKPATLNQLAELAMKFAKH